MNQNDYIFELLKINNGVIYAKDIAENNINRYYIRKLLEQNRIIKINRGIYSLPEKNINEFLIISNTYKKGVFSHNTALYFYGLTDRTPLKYDMTFPENYRISNELIKNHYISNNKYELGVTTIELEKGVSVKTYNIERTICDIIRDRNKIDPQIFSVALQEYSKMKDKNLLLLYKYAKEFNIEKKLKEYMEVLI